jgi:phospholipase C
MSVSRASSVLHKPVWGNGNNFRRRNAAPDESAINVLLQRNMSTTCRPRPPLLVISPFAKANFVDYRLTDQSSVLRFIEDNWETGRTGNRSFDAIAGSMLSMFDFRRDAVFDRDR